MSPAGIVSHAPQPHQIVVVFVDGRSLRYALGKVLPGFDPEKTPLPVVHGWSGFFMSLAEMSRRSPFTTALLRSYWYVPGSINECNEDRRPPDQNRERRLLAVDEQEAARQNHRDVVRAAGDLEFVYTGARKYKLDKTPENAWGEEKGLDVAMAVDMVRKAPIYDLAVVVSRDGDFVPAVRAVKDLGKTVVVPRFTDPQGKLLLEHSEDLLLEADRTIQVEDIWMRTTFGVKS